MSATFWAQYDAAEEMHAEREREALRAEREAATLARVPGAASRICCSLRSSARVCDPHACDVLDALWGSP